MHDKNPIGRLAQAKIRDKIQNNLYTRQAENLKGRLGKKGYPGGLKTRKGGPGKSQGFEAYNYVPFDHLAVILQYQLSSLSGTNQSNQLRTSSEREEMLRDIKEIAEWETNGIIPHSCFSLYHILYSFHSYDDILLLGFPSPCTKKRLFKLIQKLTL